MRRPRSAYDQSHIGNTALQKTPKAKPGLQGFIKGSKVCALPDTGNSKKVKSCSVVTTDWSFSNRPEETYPIDCYVLPIRNYELILGRVFLAETRTMSEHQERLTACAFSAGDALGFNLLGTKF
ncbi:MAG: hypothetical protein M1834_004759 [Cirrosporium novae-zelandiae]|nr:MAG: hypothetical protein M1834_004759 [Cirrosporium novae-zelandiae]